MTKILSLIVIMLLTGCSGSRPTLNVFIWSEYIDPQVVAEFERRFGCRVHLDFYEDNESMMAKLAGGGSALYDIVVPTDYIVPALIHRQLLAPLRHENIPNLKNVDPRFANPVFDPGNLYTAPYQWGTEGLYVRKVKGKSLEPSWALVFDPAQQPGPFLLIDDMRFCFGAALKFKGHSINSTDRKELTEARDVLIDAKKRSLGFEAGIGGRNRVLARGAVMAMVNNGDAVRAVKEDPETQYLLPEEGCAVWLDSICIPAQAPHRDLAEKFINYLLDAKVGARLANFNQYPTPNQAALEFVSPADLKNPAIYPPPDVMRRLEFDRDLGDKTKLYDELWTQVKAR
jgi:spermidine/putrescine transport system substrate-binding protein